MSSTPSPDPSPAPLMRRLAPVLGLTALALAILYVVSIELEIRAAGPEVGSIHVDFGAFWGAARLAIEGDWIAPFDFTRLDAARALADDAPRGVMYWSYPPMFHLVIAPLGALPFTAALVVWTLASFAAYAAAMRGPARAFEGAYVYMLAAPGVLVCLALGQNTVLFAACFVGAIEALRSRREVLAGVLIGLVVMKPQLGVLTPFMLAAGGHWRAIFSAGATVTAFVGLTLVWPGIGVAYWETFFAMLSDVSGFTSQALFHAERVVTWIHILALAGLSPEAAAAVQVVLMAAAVAAVAWVWTRDVPLDLKAAAFFSGIVLATPYAHQYELMFAVPAALYLARAGAVRDRRGRVLVAVLWLSHAIGLALLAGPGFLFGAPLMTLALGVTVAMARRTGAHRAGARDAS